MPRPSRAHDFAMYGGAVFVVWVVALFVTRTYLPGTYAAWVASFFPFIAVFGLGAYALSTVLYDVATFRDCPKSTFDDLQREIKDAKKRLGDLGIVTK